MLKYAILKINYIHTPIFLNFKGTNPKIRLQISKDLFMIFVYLSPDICLNIYGNVVILVYSCPNIFPIHSQWSNI